jgi:hypothetical protein
MQVTFSLADALHAIGKTRENELPNTTPVATPCARDSLATLPTLTSPLTEQNLIKLASSQLPESTIHCNYEIDPALLMLPEGTEWHIDDVDQTMLELSDWSEPAASYPNDLEALWKYPAKKMTEEMLTPHWAREMSDRKDKVNPRRMRDYRVQMMEARLHVNLMRRAKSLPLLDPEKQTTEVVEEDVVKLNEKRDCELKKRKRQDSIGVEEMDTNPRPIKAMARSHPNVGQEPSTFKIPGLTLI